MMCANLFGSLRDKFYHLFYESLGSLNSLHHSKSPTIENLSFQIAGGLVNCTSSKTGIWIDQK